MPSRFPNPLRNSAPLVYLQDSHLAKDAELSKFRIAPGFEPDSCMWGLAAGQLAWPQEPKLRYGFFGKDTSGLPDGVGSLKV